MEDPVETKLWVSYGLMQVHSTQVEPLFDWVEDVSACFQRPRQETMIQLKYKRLQFFTYRDTDHLVKCSVWFFLTFPTSLNRPLRQISLGF